MIVELVKENEKMLYACFVLALTIQLGLYTMINIVRLKFSTKHSFNALTMIPYYCILFYTIFFAMQMIAAMYTYEGERDIWISLINMSKIISQNTALSVQVFEWLCLYMMIQF